MTNDSFSLSNDERLDYINENLSLIQLKHGLTFGTDAYLLSAFAKKTGGSFADLGSGTGVCALLCLTKNKFDKCYAYEVQERFAKIINKNAVFNHLSDRLIVVNKNVAKATEKDVGTRVDAVISNPPYMKAGGGFENNSTEKNIARREILGGIDDFVGAASRLIKHGGLFYTVYRTERLPDLFCSLRENGFEAKRLITVYPDAASKPCLVLCESKKGAAPSLVVSRPLIIYTDERKYTDDMNKIYETCSTEHLFK